MKYKRHSYCLLQVLIIALLCLPALISCDNNDVINQKEEKGLIIVNLSIDGLKTRDAGDPLFTGDDRIDRIRIFVFTGEALEKNQLFTIGNTEFNNPFVLEVATGLKDVYVVANESVDLGNRLLTVTTKSGLNTILADEISSSLSLPLVMTGIKTGVEVVEMEEPDHNFTDITLTRIVSKISLKFNKNTDADVAITKVSLLSNSKKTVIWNGVGVSGQTYWNWSYTLPTPLVLSNTLTAISGQENIYLYENLAGLLNKGEATLLEVEALYNGVPSKYRVYINENVTLPGSGNAGDPNSSVTNPSDHLYSTKRNHHYQLNGTIAGIGEFDGLTLTTNVLPWNALPSYISFERKFTINPTPTLANHTYTVDNNGEVRFTFKLTSPIDASWVANLTMVGGFEFVGANSGLTDDEVIITIKAINPPEDEENITEFYINVGYGGNWSEIPLLSGSDLIGVGNRVVIRQPAN